VNSGRRPKENMKMKEERSCPHGGGCGGGADGGVVLAQTVVLFFFLHFPYPLFLFLLLPSLFFLFILCFASISLLSINNVQPSL